jgi:hypothetical protein
MKKNQLRTNRITTLFSLSILLFFSFNINAQIDLDGSNNVGIGMATPSTKLHTTGGVRFQTLAGTGTRTVLTDANGNLSAGSGAITGSGTQYYHPIWGASGTSLGNSSITEDGSGNVGMAQGLTTTGSINSIAGPYKLGSTNVIWGTYNNIYSNSRVIQNSSTTYQDGMYINYGSLGTTAAHLRFFANGTTERMRIDASNGSVGIGITTVPLQTLDVNGTLNVRNGIIQRGTTTLSGTGDLGLYSTTSSYAMRFVTNSGYTYFYSDGGIGTTPNMTIASNGYVGLGQMWPGYQLHLSTNLAGKTSTSTWSITSDIRTKTNVESYNQGLNLIRQVNIVSYKYNGLANTPFGEKGLGVIAQDFQNVFPNSVKPFNFKADSASNEAFLGVDLHELFVTNVRAVQELDSIVSAQNSLLNSKTDSIAMISTKLDSTINVQNSKIDELQNQVNQLLTTINNCCALNGGRTMQSATNPSSPTSIKQTDVKLTDAQTIVLEQNVPNPFAEQTAINYSLPDNTVKAQMLFYNAQGKLIQSTELTQKGKGTLNVFASDLSSGIYTYTLVVDGKIIETKKMVKQ